MATLWLSPGRRLLLQAAWREGPGESRGCNANVVYSSCFWGTVPKGPWLLKGKAVMIPDGRCHMASSGRDLWGWLSFFSRDLPGDVLVSQVRAGWVFGECQPHGGPRRPESTHSGCKDLGPGASCFVSWGRCPQDLVGAKGRGMWSGGFQDTCDQEWGRKGWRYQGMDNPKGPLALGMSPQELAPNLLGFFSKKIKVPEEVDEKC